VAKSEQLYVLGCALAREQHAITSSAVQCQLPIMDIADEQARQHSTEEKICLLDRAAAKPHRQTVVRTCNRARWNAGQPEQKTMVGRLIQASTPFPLRKVAASYDRGEDGRDVQREIPTRTHRHTDPPKQGSHPLGAQYSPAGAADRGWLTRSGKPPNRKHKEVGPSEVERNVGEQKLTAP